MTETELKRILVVEDDPTILDTLKIFLESEGYLVQIAENGFIALELLKNCKMPHLILLDMKMPVMNGWEFAAEFSAKYNHRAPIVVMTAASDAKQRASEITSSGWIGKPFDLDELLGVIKKNMRDTST